MLVVHNRRNVVFASFSVGNLGGIGTSVVSDVSVGFWGCTGSSGSERLAIFFLFRHVFIFVVFLLSSLSSGDGSLLIFLLLGLARSSSSLGSTLRRLLWCISLANTLLGCVSCKLATGYMLWSCIRGDASKPRYRVIWKRNRKVVDLTLSLLWRDVLLSSGLLGALRLITIFLGIASAGSSTSITLHLGPNLLE
jgi:hypothetical protein